MCPAFAVALRKPWPFGNECASSCGCNLHVVHRLDLVEGKDRLEELEFRELEEMGKAVGETMHLTRPAWRTDTKATVDSRFCAAKGSAESRKRGVAAAVQMKKRKYWHVHFQSDATLECFCDNEVGCANAMQVELDRVKFCDHGMKEPDHMARHLAICRTLERM